MNMSKNGDDDAESETIALGLDHLQGIFFILIFGHVLACFLLFIEVMAAKKINV